MTRPALPYRRLVAALLSVVALAALAAPAASADTTERGPLMITVPNPLGSAATAGQSVQGVRSGEHRYYTRIVLDVSGPAGFAYGLTPDRRGVLVDLPGVRWAGAASGSLPNPTRVASWQVLSGGADGSRLLIVGDRPLHVLRALPLPPDRQRGHRLVLDIAEWAGPLSTLPEVVPGHDGWR